MWNRQSNVIPTLRVRDRFPAIKNCQEHLLSRDYPDATHNPARYAIVHYAPIA